MKFCARALLIAVATMSVVAAFAPSTRPRQHKNAPQASFQSCRNVVKSQSPVLLFSATESEHEAPTTCNNVDLTNDEWTIVKDLVNKAANDISQLEELVAQSLPTMHPSFIMKLRSVEQQTVDESNNKELVMVASALQTVLDARLAGGKEVLAQLLDAGEIRKLDASIGKFAREGKLDMAFFTVLNMNMQAAAGESGDASNDSASRTQVLQHIYTRCQEEVEKNVPGGVALLNKLLRTEIASIRSNQLEHYLCPQSNVITSPDGKEIELGGTKPVLVPPSEFMDALAGAVKQIRTVEQAGGTDKESAANLVESCRQVASEARLAIAKHYGVDSTELKEFEDGLMPVFRPDSPDSPYIQGQ